MVSWTPGPESSSIVMMGFIEAVYRVSPACKTPYRTSDSLSIIRSHLSTDEMPEILLMQYVQDFRQPHHDPLSTLTILKRCKCVATDNVQERGAGGSCNCGA